MSFLGMDIDHVREHVRACESEAVKLHDLKQRLDMIVHGADWIGPDRDAFVGQWQLRVRTELENAHDQLIEHARLLMLEIAEQEQASAPDGATTGMFEPFNGSTVPLSASEAIGSGDALLARVPGLDEISALFGIFGEPIDSIDPRLLQNNIFRTWWEAIKDFGRDPDKYTKALYDMPYAQQAALEIVAAGIISGELDHRIEVESHGVREVEIDEHPKNLEDLILANAETRGDMPNAHPYRDNEEGHEAQIRVQKVVGEDGIERYIVQVPPTQGEKLHKPGGWDGQTQPFGWDNNLYAMAGMPNAGAEAVKLAMQEAGVPQGAEIALVGHSQGGLVAAQLAADPQFNGCDYVVSDVFSVGSPVETYTPALDSTDVTNIRHTPQTGSKGDFVPRLDLGGASPEHPTGNPAPNVHEVKMVSPIPSDKYKHIRGMERSHDSVLRLEGETDYDTQGGYYGTVRNNPHEPGISAKDARMRGKYYGDGVELTEDRVVNITRKPS